MTTDPSNLRVPYTQFDFYNYYRDAQGDLVYLPNVSKPVIINQPQEVDMSTYKPDPRDPGNAPFIFPEGLTAADVLAAQANQLSKITDASTLALLQTTLRAEEVVKPIVWKVPTTTTVVEGFESIDKDASSDAREESKVSLRSSAFLVLIAVVLMIFHYKVNKQ